MPATSNLWVASVVGVVLWCCIGCANAGAGAGDDATSPACDRTSTLVDGPNCSVQWNCSETGSHSLLCAELDDGSTACQCKLGEELGELAAVEGGCGEEPYELRAQSVCGWSFE
jgi:hypothetical protein